MLIDKIILNNYRVYKGLNTVAFEFDHEKNITIISGNNGFGKTSFLTSLVWCLYGKMMTDVDEKYRKEILESGGYKKYCEKTININFLKDFKSLRSKEGCQFSVSVELSRVFIPTIPGDSIRITRTHDILTGQEDLFVLLDNKENELTKELGPEIFINDFILPKEIAKFFFFDSEKIVSLAEMRSIDEKRQLSRAYSEILGIKKYEDLRRNLENLQLKLRKNNKSDKGQIKLNEFSQALKKKEDLVEFLENSIEKIKEEIARKKIESDHYQERLIREGSTVTLEELKKIREKKGGFEAEGKQLRSAINELLEFAPFAIASKKLDALYQQAMKEADHEEQMLSKAFLISKFESIKKDLEIKTPELNLHEHTKSTLVHILEKHLLIDSEIEEFRILLDFKAEESNSLKAIRDNLKNSFSKRLKEISKKHKINQSNQSIIKNKLTNAETKENDLVIQEIRKEKIRMDKEITHLENQLIENQARLIHVGNEINNQKKLVSEFSKKVEVFETDLQKDQYASRLIEELTVFTNNLKKQKKQSLEKKLFDALSKLMHKSDFIDRVEVNVAEDLIDIDLYSPDNRKINKEVLSKGEQQLYATALLKALVDESNIKFPLFVDSPLQKFDRQHAHNIVTGFYPSISDQVVLFPLLEKELSGEEYTLLLDRVKKAYVIEQIDRNHSQLREVAPELLFETQTSSIL